jgi:ABC-2 type transport system ATP-binding protein
VQVKGDRAELRTEDADATVTALVHSGRTWRDLEVTTAGLESAFLALTGAIEE